MSASSIRKAAAWTVSACLAILGLVAAASGWGTDFQFAMLFMAGMALICTAIWFCAYGTKGIFRAMSAGVLAAGSLLVGIMEPFCGPLGHSSCYSGCGGNYNIAWVIWIIVSLVGHGGIALCQMHTADDLSLSRGLFLRKALPS